MGWDVLAHDDDESSTRWRNSDEGQSLGIVALVDRRRLVTNARVANK
jgi:hypothetical protein